MLAPIHHKISNTSSKLFAQSKLAARERTSKTRAAVEKIEESVRAAREALRGAGSGSERTTTGLPSSLARTLAVETRGRPRAERVPCIWIYRKKIAWWENC